MKKINVKKEIIVSAIVFLVLLFTVAACIFVTAKKYVAYVNLPGGDYRDFRIRIQGEGNCDVTELKQEGRSMVLLLENGKEGKFDLTVECIKKEESMPADKVSYGVTVSGHHLIFFGPDMDYRGHQVVAGAAALYMTYIGVIMFIGYRRYRKVSAFSYNGLMRLGLSLYFIVQGFLAAGICLGGILFRSRAGAYQLLGIASLIFSLLILALLPLMILFSVVMSVSNAALVRHEGFRFANLLGFIISGLMMLGSVGIILSVVLTPAYLTPTLKDTAMLAARIISNSIFAYMVCILFASEFLLISVAKNEPAPEQDFIIILGCAIRKDGTLYPLLQGRADRAVAFYEKQRKETGKKAVFIPSGGQGSDEVISEGEAIKNYLLSCGIPDEQIIPETESASTFENMKFSKKIIDERKKGAKVIFSTTNYHVFRSGMIAAASGLAAEGIGSQTKWYFWPNAQIREFVGLLAGKWKEHLIICLILIASAVPMACGPMILNWIVY